MPRPHQFFAVKQAQERVRKREGGVIWHTQGSGKSIVMVLLAKWVMEHDPHARILIITDRDELDKQIESVMRNAGVIGADAPSPRVTTRDEFAEKLGKSESCDSSARLSRNSSPISMLPVAKNKGTVSTSSSNGTSVIDRKVASSTSR